MNLVRQIRDGISAPGKLAIGPSGDLFVANWNYETKSAYITEYRPGGSKPVLTITKGFKVPGALAVDSKGRLYVATPDYQVRSGWISVYAPGGSQPVRKVHISNPVALAFDPSDNLYVANQAKHNSVLVYNVGATNCCKPSRWVPINRLRSSSARRKLVASRSKWSGCSPRLCPSARLRDCEAVASRPRSLDRGATPAAHEPLLRPYE